MNHLLAFTQSVSRCICRLSGSTGSGIALMLFLWLIASPLQAQHIGFGLSFGANISMEIIGNSENEQQLNFSSSLLFPFLVRGTDGVAITRTENEQSVVLIAIDAPEGSDITVTVNAPHELTIDGDNSDTLPFQIGWAYWNLGATTSETINTGDYLNAREVVSVTGMGMPFSSVTFPATRTFRGVNGPPPPPPMPNFSGRNTGSNPVPMVRSFLLIYGSINQVKANQQVGIYTGVIGIEAELSIYNNSSVTP